MDEFRPIGGVRNNLDDPSLNSVPGSSETRLTPRVFAPGTKDDLVSGPNPRTISNEISAAIEGGKGDVQDPDGVSAWQYVFGQFVDHDLDLQSVKGTASIDIPVPLGDRDIKQATLPLTRAVVDPITGALQTQVTSYLDLSQVYGSDEERAASLRNADGTMKTSPGNNLLIGPDGQFLAGDVRVQENPELSGITLLFVRNHNTLVADLKAKDPTLTGDQLYDKARELNTAIYQNIVYNEFVPSDIGPNAIARYKGFDPTVNPNVSEEFATDAFRVGHSQVSNGQSGVDNKGVHTFDESLSDSFANTPAQTIANGFDALLRHISSDPSQKTDVFAVDGVRNLLMDSSLDLIAIDIQRERDVGIGSLNEVRTAMGMTPYASFADLTPDPELQAALARVFGTIDQVDLFIGGLAETHAPGADVGPTFQAIIADTFTRVRDGDRFFWMNQVKDPTERAMIQSTTLSDVLKRNTDTPLLQDDVFIATDRHLSSSQADNPLLPQLIIGVDDAGAAIVGGPASDFIAAGDGDNQVLAGGRGNDTFLFNFSGHDYSVTDFIPGSDSLRFLQPGAASLGQDGKGDVVVSQGGSTVVLAGVSQVALVQHAGAVQAPGGLLVV